MTGEEATSGAVQQPEAQTTPPAPEPAPAPEAAPSKGKGPMIAIVAIVAVVVILALVFMFVLGGTNIDSPIVGSWNIESADAMGFSTPMTGTLEFKADGTGSGSVSGSGGSFDWSEVDGDTIKMNDGSMEIEMDWTVTGTDMTLSYTESGVTVTLYLTKA